MKHANCPQCQKKAPWQNNPFRPFCSERCRQIDLGQWASEAYRIPTNEPAELELPDGDSSNENN